MSENINWNFDASQVESKNFETLSPGKYRVRVEAFEPCKSKSGMDMIKFTFAVSGKQSKLWEYLVFNPNQKGITNTKIAQISDSFGVTAGDFNPNSWLGKIGACQTKIDSEGYAKCSYFIAKFKQEILPQWREPSKNSMIIPKSAPMPDIFEDDIPM